MKTKTNHTFFFKAMVLVLAFTLAVLCAPMDALVALAQMSNYTDYSYMTIGKFEDEIKTTVTKGNKYTITEAYIGGDTRYVVGRDLATGTAIGKTADAEEVKYISSSVTVKYASQDVEVTKLTDDAKTSDYGTFVADKLGTYTITYSYVYQVGADEENTFTNKYELKINSELESASISLESNQENFIPSLIDLGQLTPVYDQNDSTVITGYKDVNENDKTFVLPKATITDEDGDEISSDKLTYVVSKDEMTTAGKYVLVTVKGGNDAGDVTLSQQGDEISIPMSTFVDPNKAAEKYTITYALYEKSVDLVSPYLITSTTKSFNVEYDYYADETYDLKLELASSWSDSAQTGVESTLPAAKGVTSKETVDVYYRVKVYHNSTSSTNAWTDIATKDIYADVLEGGYLKDATTFKPLEDGYYTFEYEIFDFYGNSVKSEKGTYEFTDVKDKTNPTPVVYDASQYVGANASNEKIDEDYKLQTRSNPSAPVVVYAIGINDNVSTESTDGVELTRKIVTSDTVTKLTITTHNDKNLVFNYTNTNDQDNAYDNLISNNYNIRKSVGDTITNDTAMLAWLKDNNYMVVVDDVNASKLYSIFNNVEADETSIFADVESVANASTAEEKEAAAIAWLKSDASASKGFAYISSSETFGATGTNGMGTGSYKIHYIAQDAAGNSSEVTKTMSIYSYDDTTAPDMKFSTTLADTYLPDSTITFDAPTASDNYDTNMLVKTMYRYLDSEGKVITIKDKEDKTISTESVAGLKTDLGTNVDKNGTLITEKYSKFFTSTSTGEAGYDVAAGYVDLTDESASSYSIDISEAGNTAVKLQIVTFAYDDCGNVGIYAEEINISNATDNAPPALSTIDKVDFRKDYVQGEEIELPSLTVKDDAASYMSYEVNVYHVASDNTETKIATYDSYSSRDVQHNGLGSYTVYGGKFVASFAGNYKASIAVKDSKNKTIVTFVEYSVASRNIVQPPVISASIESKTVELDESPVISIPTPTVNYEIADSVLYSELNAASTETYVIMGVDENNKATNWSTNHGQAHSFKPTEIGEYNIKYNVKLTVYNRSIFNYEEMKYDKDKGYVGGYFTMVGKSTPIEIVNENEFKVLSSATTNNETYYVVRDDEGNFDVLDSERDSIFVENGNGGINYSTILSGLHVEAFEEITALEDFATWFSELKLYSLDSETYTIIAQDTTGPVIAEQDYAVSMSTEALATTGIKIYGIEATDVGSGINADKSKIVVSWKLANGESGTKTYDKTDNKNMTGDDFIKSSTGKNYDGTYKITYTVYDNNNNYSTKEYTIAVGDNVAPTVTMKEDVLLDTYTVGTSIEIKLSDIEVKDNKELNNSSKTITLTNTSTDTVIEDKGNGDTLVYDLSEVGTYTLTVEVEDAVGNTTTETYEFEVVAKTQDSTLTYKIVGTVLIVVSVLILAGVIVYFVVSKVKLDKELKK